MTPILAMLFWAVVRASLFVTLAALVVGHLLTRFKIQSPRVHRCAAVLVLLPGWMLLPFSISIPWYDPPSRPAVASSQSPSVQSPEANHAKSVVKGEGPTASRANSPHIHSQASRWITRSPWPNLFDGSMLFAVWILGAACVAVGFVVAYAAVWLGTTRQRADHDTQLAWDHQLGELGGPPTLPLWFTHVAGPMLCLFPRGYELWTPREFWNSISANEQQAIARHELSHWRRGDVWKSWLVRVLALPQWFNPAAWWAVHTFDTAGEWLCDADATPNENAKADYLQALVRLADWHRAHRPESISSTSFPTTYPVTGHCAHAHPLVVRVRRLLTSHSVQDSCMNQHILLAAATLLAVVPMFRIDLVARAADPPAALQAVKDQIQNLDTRLETLKKDLERLKERGQSLKTEIEGRVAVLKELREDPTKLSDELKRRGEKFKSGLEAEQLAVLDNLDKLGGDEQLLALGLVGKDSPHESVRRKALVAVCAMGDLCIPAIALAYEALNGKDRCFLAEELAKKPSEDRLIMFAHMAKNADEELLKTLLGLKLDAKSKLTFLATIAEGNKENDDFANALFEIGEKTDGDDGLMVLYAIAKSGNDKHVARAVELAAKRKEAALPVIAAAFKKGEKLSRAAVVKAAKQIGGEAGKFIIDTALADVDAELKAAAEEANK